MVEALPIVVEGTNARGWAKFVAFMTGANALILWQQHNDHRAAAVAGWVLESLAAQGVQPDGFSTGLGTMYSSMMGIPAGSTVQDAAGQFHVRGGDDGRALAGL